MSGLDYKDNEKISKEIKNLNLNNIYFVNFNKVNEIISSNSLVEKFEILAT